MKTSQLSNYLVVCRTFAWIVLATHLVPPLAAQTPQPLGPSIRVDTLQASRNRDVQAAWRCDADVLMVVWQSHASAGPDVDGDSLQGRFFSGGQATGPQFQVNQATAGDQRMARILVDDGGNFVVFWITVDGDDRTLHRRSFDRNSLAPGPEQTVGSPMARIDGYDVAADGRAGIAWWDGQFVRAQLYDTDGLPIGPELAVQFTNLDEASALPALHLLPEQTILSWSASEVPDNLGVFVNQSIEMQRFALDGSTIGSQVAIAGASWCGVSCGTLLSDKRTRTGQDGDFVVSFKTTSYPENASYDIDVERYSADNEVQFVGTAASSYALPIENEDLRPEVDGDFLVVWSDAATQAQARRIADGAVNPDPSFQLSDRQASFTTRYHTAVMGPSSSLAVVWNGSDPSEDCWPANNTSSQCVWLRRFKSSPGVLTDGFESGDASRWCVARGL